MRRSRSSALGIVTPILMISAFDLAAGAVVHKVNRLATGIFVAGGILGLGAALAIYKYARREY